MPKHHPHSPHHQHVPPVTAIVSIAERRRPAVTRREWGALAVAAAARAGLNAPGLASLRLNLADQWACDEQERALKG